MTTTVLASTPVVKPPAGDCGTHPRDTPGVETIADRIEAILREQKISASALSVRAGLTRIHVNKVITRVRANPEARIESSTLEAIARAAGVTVGWLLTGRNESAGANAPPLVQTAMHVKHTERYAGRAEAERLMRGVLPDPAVDSVMPWDLNATQDPGVAWWIERMKEAARTMKHWDKNPSAERAELEKRRNDGDVLEAVLDGMQANAAAEQAKLRAAETANDAPTPPTKPAPPASKKAKRPRA